MSQKTIPDQGVFTYRIPLGEALGLRLHKTSLGDHLVDEAEWRAVEEHGEALFAHEVETDTSVSDGELVITFTWDHRASEGEA